jgi:protocatechuate 3,4-dioxygenase beta subunit
MSDRSPAGSTLAQGIWLVVLALLVALVATMTARPNAVRWSEEPLPTSETEGEGEEPEGPIARVRGTILLEVPRPEPPPMPGADTEASIDTESTADTTTGEPAEDPSLVDPTAAEDIPPTPVDLVPPPARSCRIRAWQEGRQVGSATCDAEGAFELELEAGIAGRVAFELEVPLRLRAVVEVEVPAGGIGRLPTVALGFGTTVRGEVVDADNAPLAGVEIQASPDPNLGEAVPWRTTSDASGEFVFDTLPPGPVRMRATKQGFAPSEVQCIAPEEDVLVTMSELFDMSGEVIGPAEVLARTKARIEGSGIWPPITTALDGSTFVFPAVPDGVYAIEAVAEATVPGEPEFASMPLENVTPDLYVTLALAPAHRIRVRVVDDESRPVAGARVTVGNSQVGLLQRIARTDEAGAVSMGPLVSGTYVVRADADGFLPSEAVEVALEDASVEGIELRLVRPGRIAGIVVDEDDHPVEGAAIVVEGDSLHTLGESEVRARVFDRSLVAAGTLGVTQGPVPEIPAFPDAIAEAREYPSSDASGAFAIEGLAAGTYRLVAVHGQFARSDVVEIPLRAGEQRTGVRLRLRTGHALTGRVLDGNLRPIEGALVELDDGSVYFTDDRGVFDAGLRRGRQTVVARAPDKVASLVEVAMAGRPRDIEIVLQDADAGLAGRVTDDNHRPLAGARVSVRMLDGVTPTQIQITDDRGLYAFDALPADAAELEVDHPAHRVEVASAKLIAGKVVTVDVQLAPAWSLVLEVRDRETARPISGATIAGSGTRARTGDDGRVELAGLGEDRVELEVAAAGYGSRIVAVERGDAEGATERIVELSSGGALAGIVTDYRGDPVAAATVIARDREGGEVLAETTASATGAFRFDALPEGELWLEAEPPPSLADVLAPAAQASDVLRGRTTRDVDLRLERR